MSVASIIPSMPITVDRSTFERISAGLLERAIRPVHDVLARIKLAVEDVDELVLVGGSSRMARIRQLLGEALGDREPNCDVSPEEAVAVNTQFPFTTVAGKYFSLYTVPLAALSDDHCVNIATKTLVGAFGDTALGTSR